MEKHPVIEALERGVQWNDGWYCSTHRYFQFQDDGTIHLKEFAKEGDEITGIDTHEHSTATVPAGLLDRAIVQALRTGQGHMECSVSLSQHLIDDDPEYRKRDVILKVHIECHGPQVTVDINY